MKRQISLRQMAKHLGVSHSYLSQVLNGKRPPSARVAQALSGKQMVSNIEANMGLKIRFLQGSVGSSPSLGSQILLNSAYLFSFVILLNSYHVPLPRPRVCVFVSQISEMYDGLSLV